MPILSYFVVVGSMLLGLIFAADYVWGPQTRSEPTVAAHSDPASSIKLTSTVSTRDLRREVVSVRPVPPAEPVTTGVAAIEPPGPVTPSSETPKQTSRKTAEVKKNDTKKKKTNVVTARPKPEQYAHSYQYDYWRQPYYGGWY